jgi:hypothetical protein
MSPEQARGEVVTAASDLFSLGAVLYLMTTGKAAFAGPTPAAILTTLATKNPDPPSVIAPGVPQALSDLIMRLLAKEPADRPPSAAAVADELGRIEGELPGEKGRPSAPSTSGATPPAKPRARRRRAAAGLLVLVGVGLLALVLAWLLAPGQVRVVTPKGTLVIESDDPNVEVVVRKNGVLIRDRTREREIALEVGDYTIDLAEKKDGLKLSTDRFSITQDGKETVRVRFEKNEPARALSPENHRRLAEWVLKQEEGLVQPAGSANVSKAADLPQRPFRCARLEFALANLQALSPEVADWLKSLPAQTYVGIRLASRDWGDQAFGKLVFVLKDIPNTHVSLETPCAITDEGLKHLAEVSGLKGIVLSALVVSDEGVRPLTRLEHLDILHLLNVPVTDSTVELFLARGTLHQLVLHHTQASPACLATLLKNINLEYLHLWGLPLTDEDMRRLCGLTKLWTLDIANATVTNDGCRHLEAVPSLSKLHISCEKVNDGVFEHLRKLKYLTQLRLDGMTDITDEGLLRVTTLPKLETLTLTQCRVTAAGVARLRAEMPKLRVEWDGDKKQP